MIFFIAELSSLAPVEMIVEAGAHDIFVHRDIVRSRRAAIDTAIEVAEVDMEIFALGGPMARQRKFEAAADRPAGIGGACGREAGKSGADIAHRETARDIRQDAAERIADASAHGRKPAVADVAAYGAQRRGGGAVEIR